MDMIKGYHSSDESDSGASPLERTATDFFGMDAIMGRIKVGPEGGSPPALEVPQPTAAAVDQILPKKQGVTGRAAVDLTATEHLVLAEGPAKRKEVKVEQKRSKKRSKQFGPQLCLLCRKPITLMRNHLNVHKLDSQTRQFLLSFHRTKNVKIPVYQCNTCMVRFTNPWRDHKGHEKVRIRDVKVTSTFPPSIKAIISKQPDGVRKSKVVIDEYDDYQKGGVVNNGISSTTRRMLTEAMSATDSLLNPKSFKNFVHEWKRNNGYKAKTVLNYLSRFMKFLRYVALYHQALIRNREFQWDAVNKEVRDEYTKASGKEQSLTTIRLFEKVPSMAEIQEMRRKVNECLSDDLEDNALSYMEAAAMNFFLKQSSLNIRPGPLLMIKSSDYKEMVSDMVYPNTDHKTGHLYTIGLMIREKERPCLNQMLQKFTQQNGMKPEYLFSNNKGTRMTTIAKLINTVLDNHFGCGGKSFAPTSVRKMWETYKSKSKSFKGIHDKAHTSQSGHCEKTANKFYVQPPTKEELKGLIDYYEQVMDNEKEDVYSLGPSAGSSMTFKDVSENRLVKRRKSNSSESEEERYDDNQKILQKRSKNLKKTARKCKSFPCERRYYESDQCSGDSLDDEEYNLPKELKVRVIKLPSIKSPASYGSSLKETGVSKYSKDEYAENTSADLQSTDGQHAAKQQFFVEQLMKFKGNVFTPLDRNVMKSFCGLNVAPTVSMVRQRFAVFIKPNEIDDFAVRRVYAKLKRAWVKYMKN